ncbi:MAG: DUF1549 domain-containing protein [Planctomycetes bacterium]|nr:DUF1549 domain-containing protein [Planctomycetota bacterium]
MSQLAVLLFWSLSLVSAGRTGDDDPSTHWAFAPLRTAPLPAGESGESAIDRLVRTRVDAMGLELEPAADRATLIRRVTLDLIGLPPTPDEIEAFVNDGRPDAWERLVDRLLASPHYGERWARRWLDRARYADTNGFEKDRPRTIWPYRDWVIQALNDDLPFDRFTIEQLAGDLLPEASITQRVATGFHRNTMINEEGGIDVEEFRHAAIVDRVHVTATTFLGVTLACAQCHDHPYDPFSQREYYELLAFLNDCDEVDLPVPTPELEAQRRDLEAQIASLESSLRERLQSVLMPAEIERRRVAWEASLREAARVWTTPVPASMEALDGANLDRLGDGSILVSGDLPNRDTYVLRYAFEHSKTLTGLRLEALPHPSLPENGPGRAPLHSPGDFMLGELTWHVRRRDGTERRLALARPSADYAAGGFDVTRAIDDDLDTGWAVKGQIGRAHHAVFPLAEPLVVEAFDQVEVRLLQRYIHQMTLGRFRVSFTGDPRTLQAFPHDARLERAVLLVDAERSEDERAALELAFLRQTKELEEVVRRIDTLRARVPEFPRTLVMQARPAGRTRTTHLRHRGEFRRPTEVVEPGTPAALHALRPSEERPRLRFARWLVSPRNALMARVVVNRHWEAFFGRGLVKTLEDFGHQAEKPSHPDLLEWLAAEFLRSDQSIKGLHRAIVCTDTYRRSSDVSAVNLERDPENVWLARAPRLRLDAELVRDLALCASGEFSGVMFGPSVFPPQPDGVTSLSFGSLAWRESTGASRYRRGLYTFSKRTTPYAAFAAFDAPSGEALCARRERTHTPLQALFTLNDEAFVEAARDLAWRVTRRATFEERVQLLFLLLLGRKPDEVERVALQEFLETERSLCARDPEGVKALLGTLTRRAPSEEHVELAAWFLLSRVVLNLEEAVTRS